MARTELQAWMDDFVQSLMQKGMSGPYAMNYYRDRKSDALEYAKTGRTPREAATDEVQRRGGENEQ